MIMRARVTLPNLRLNQRCLSSMDVIRSVIHVVNCHNPIKIISAQLVKNTWNALLIQT